MLRSKNNNWKINSINWFPTPNNWKNRSDISLPLSLFFIPVRFFSWPKKSPWRNVKIVVSTLWEKSILYNFAFSRAFSRKRINEEYPSARFDDQILIISCDWIRGVWTSEDLEDFTFSLHWLLNRIGSISSQNTSDSLSIVLRYRRVCAREKSGAPSPGENLPEKSNSRENRNVLFYCWAWFRRNASTRTETWQWSFLSQIFSFTDLLQLVPGNIPLSPDDLLSQPILRLRHRLSYLYEISLLLLRSTPTKRSFPVEKLQPKITRIQNYPLEKRQTQFAMHGKTIVTAMHKVNRRDRQNLTVIISLPYQSP